MDKGAKTDQKETPEPNSNNFARGDSNDEDVSDGTCSSHSTLCPHVLSSLNNPSHHAQSPPSLSPVPSESTPTPPGDRCHEYSYLPQRYHRFVKKFMT